MMTRYIGLTFVFISIVFELLRVGGTYVLLCGAYLLLSAQIDARTKK